MADLKKKFIDILFDDDDEVVEKSSSKSSIKASDLLYHKSPNSVFVNLDEPKVSSTNSSDSSFDDNAYEQYEMSSHISPIFGVIKQSKIDDGVILSKETIEAQTNKPNDSHLDIITSPIFGYSSKEDVMNDAYKNNLNIRDSYSFEEPKKIEEVKIEPITYSESENDALHRLFDDDTHRNESFDQLDSTQTQEVNLFNLFDEEK